MQMRYLIVFTFFQDEQKMQITFSSQIHVKKLSHITVSNVVRISTQHITNYFLRTISFLC